MQFETVIIISAGNLAEYQQELEVTVQIAFEGKKHVAAVLHNGRDISFLLNERAKQALLEEAGESDRMIELNAYMKQPSNTAGAMLGIFYPAHY